MERGWRLGVGSRVKDIYLGERDCYWKYSPTTDRSCFPSPKYSKLEQMNNNNEKHFPYDCYMLGMDSFPYHTMWCANPLESWISNGSPALNTTKAHTRSKNQVHSIILCWWLRNSIMKQVINTQYDSWERKFHCINEIRERNYNQEP